MQWEAAALKELEKAPEFVREMAKEKAESVVKAKGREITYFNIPF